MRRIQMQQPTVTKEYREDRVDPDGGHGEEYRYWDYMSGSSV